MTGKPAKKPHSKSKKHECTQCKKTFPYASNLRFHEATVHRGERPHCCDVCTKHFASAAHLRRHVANVHRGERQHKCSQCEKSFAQPHALKLHVAAVHDGERPHKCVQCGKSFARKGDLKGHVAALHGSGRERKHACATCGRKFFKKAHVKRHEAFCGKAGTKARAKHVCDLCGTSFPTKCDLQLHQLNADPCAPKPSGGGEIPTTVCTTESSTDLSGSISEVQASSHMTSDAGSDVGSSVCTPHARSTSLQPAELPTTGDSQTYSNADRRSMKLCATDPAVFTAFEKVLSNKMVHSTTVAASERIFDSGRFLGSLPSPNESGQAYDGAVFSPFGVDDRVHSIPSSGRNPNARDAGTSFANPATISEVKDRVHCIPSSVRIPVTQDADMTLTYPASCKESTPETNELVTHVNRSFCSNPQLNGGSEDSADVHDDIDSRGSKDSKIDLRKRAHFELRPASDGIMFPFSRYPKHLAGGSPLKMMLVDIALLLDPKYVIYYAASTPTQFGPAFMRVYQSHVVVALRDSLHDEFAQRSGFELLDKRSNRVLWFSEDSELGGDVAHVATKVCVNGHEFPHAVVLGFLGGLRLSDTDFTIDVRSGTKLAYAGGKFECPKADCTVLFDSISNTKTHFRACHSTLKMFACDICAKEFNTAYGLKNHKRTHSVAELACAECDRRFKHKHALLSHVLHAHQCDQLAVECDQCAKRFASASHLARHAAAVHRGERPFACGECDRSFSDKGARDRHVSAVHRKERPFACGECDRRFSLKANMRRHCERAHASNSTSPVSDKDKRVVCLHKECGGKTFSDKYVLARHVRAVHSDKKHSCERCDSVFAWRASLTRHLAKCVGESRA